jgi:hypothetical protein
MPLGLAPSKPVFNGLVKARNFAAEKKGLNISADARVEFGSAAVALAGKNFYHKLQIC